MPCSFSLPAVSLKSCTTTSSTSHSTPLSLHSRPTTSPQCVGWVSAWSELGLSFSWYLVAPPCHGSFSPELSHVGLQVGRGGGAQKEKDVLQRRGLFQLRRSADMKELLLVPFNVNDVTFLTSQYPETSCSQWRLPVKS